MVAQVNRRGFRDWIIQRISALLIASYTLVVFVYVLSHPNLAYIDWFHLYANIWMRIYTVVVLAALLWHAWIGLWTVFTDYIKSTALRLFLELLVFVALIAYMIWCLDILWA